MTEAPRQEQEEAVNGLVRQEFVLRGAARH